MEPSNAPHPVSCEKTKEGLLFRYSDGTARLIPDWSAPAPRDGEVENGRKAS